MCLIRLFRGLNLRPPASRGVTARPTDGRCRISKDVESNAKIKIEKIIVYIHKTFAVKLTSQKLPLCYHFKFNLSWLLTNNAKN